MLTRNNKKYKLRSDQTCRETVCDKCRKPTGTPYSGCLKNTDLENADLRPHNLENADLRPHNLENADLRPQTSKMQASKTQTLKTQTSDHKPRKRRRQTTDLETTANRTLFRLTEALFRLTGVSKTQTSIFRFSDFYYFTLFTDIFYYHTLLQKIH